MTAIPPPPPNALPQGMSDVDYEAIEAAVTETVRGRWFLNEFARRNRASEARLMLDGLSRLESLITQASLPAPPSADPSIRLMIQRIKEITGALEGVAQTMRDDDVEERLCVAVDLQARAVAGLMRTGTVAAPAPQRVMETPRIAAPVERPAPETDPRLRVFAGLDSLPLAKKLALFT